MGSPLHWHHSPSPVVRPVSRRQPRPPLPRPGGPRKGSYGGFAPGRRDAPCCKRTTAPPGRSAALPAPRRRRGRREAWHALWLQLAHRIPIGARAAGPGATRHCPRQLGLAAEPRRADFDESAFWRCGCPSRCRLAGPLESKARRLLWLQLALAYRAGARAAGAARHCPRQLAPPKL